MEMLVKSSPMDVPASGLERSSVLPNPRNEIIVRQPISDALHRNFKRHVLSDEISPNHRSPC